jgi:predicted nucleic acid-binding protein
MKVTVDANALFASLIRDSTARQLFFNPALALYAPEFLIDELVRHIMEVQEKSGLRDEELSHLVAKAFAQVTFVSDKELKPFLPAAASLIKDSKDWLYLACALREDTAMWSNDNHFTSQRRVKVLTTKALLAMVGSL